MEKNGVTVQYKAVVIGGSAGSLEVLFKMLPLLKHDIAFTIIIVLHRRNSGDSSLTDLLASKCKIAISEVEDKDPLESNHIYLAPSDYHLLIEQNLTFSLDYSEKINFSRPSLDVTFESASEVFSDSLIGVILSGANEDGTKGLETIKKGGGVVIAQNPETAQIATMPQHAINAQVADHILDITEIASFLNEL